MGFESRDGFKNKGKNEEVNNMMEKMMALVKDESGQGMAEYGLILALVAVVVIGALIALGSGVGTKMQEVADELQ